MLENKVDFIIKTLDELFPNAKCELNYSNIYELCVAVILSAQTTDKSVNSVTPKFFIAYPDVYALSKANPKEVETYIARLGLSQRKSELIVKFALTIVNEYFGVIPDEMEELIKIPGIGRKTANVIVSEGFGKPGLAVDTHVLRVSNRLGLVNSLDPFVVEKELKMLFPEELWHFMHHHLIFMGRYLCSSRSPKCSECPFKDICKYFSK